MFVEINKIKLSEGRAYKLNDGDVFTVVDTMIEFENGNYYEVIELSYTFRNGIFPMKKYVRTGKTFTAKDVNNMVKGD